MTSYSLLQAGTLLLVSIAMATALAHALELPGKLRLPEEVYLAVQPIYYPGFTIAGGVGEFGGMLATLVLLLFTAPHQPAFWYTLAALITLLCMHAIFWLLTQPANRFWLRNQSLARPAATFFGRRRGSPDSYEAVPWTTLRDQWEYSHLIRAVLALFALALLALAVAVSPGSR